MAKLYIKEGQILSAKQIVIKADGYQIINPTEEMLLENGWVEYVAPETVSDMAETERRHREDEIEHLKQRLSESDYKVIKCMEAYLSNDDLPYNITELHRERNELRDRINDLEHENENF